MPELLLGRFQTMAVEIREGGMSTVKKALDLQTGKFVAVKFLDISSSGELIGPMFRNEVESLKSLWHLPLPMRIWLEIVNIEILNLGTS